MLQKAWVLTLWLLVVECHGSRILAFLPINAHGHQNIYRPIFRELAKRGHDVTYVTSIPDAKAPYKQIIIENRASDMDVEMEFFSMPKKGFLDNLFMVFNFLEYSTRSTLSNPEVQKLINSTDLHFDLVFTESMIEQESYIALGHKFQAPIIEVSSISPMFWLYHLMGNPYSFSYTTSMFSRSTGNMGFIERLHNTVQGVFSLLYSRFYSLPVHEAIVKEYFQYPGSESRPPLIDLLSNVSLVLLATHLTTHMSHPYNPNVVEIGGIQLEQPETLPQDLQQYLDEASEGVIYFSMGSIVKSNLMPDTTRQALVSAFAKLPYRVLWKWEAEALPDQPKNVKVVKWLPQKDIMAHPNIKLFVTHGGLGSYTEAIYNGVPLVVIPVFVDQWKNCKQVEAAGNGLYLNFDNITEQSVIWAVTTVLENPSYREVAQTQSRIFRDRPISAMDSAMYWIEYVLRHKGAPHLRTPAAALPWYKYFLVDVVAVLLSAFIVTLYVVYLAIRTTYRFLRARYNQCFRGKGKKKIN